VRKPRAHVRHVAIVHEGKRLAAFAFRPDVGRIEAGYLTLGPAGSKYRRGRGRSPVLSASLLARRLGGDDVRELNLIAVLEHGACDDERHVRPAVEALAAQGGVTAITDVRLDEVDEALGVPEGLTGTDEGEKLLQEIVIERTDLTFGNGDQALVRAVALLLALDRADGKVSDAVYAPTTRTTRTRPSLPSPDRDYLTVAEVAGALGIDRSTAYRLADAGAFSTYRVGRQIRVQRGDLLAYLARQRAPSSEEIGQARRDKVVAVHQASSASADDEQRGLELARKLGTTKR
jgi:excisionase family DNA binding protein